MSDGAQNSKDNLRDLQHVCLHHLEQIKVIKGEKKKVETKWILLSKM